MSRDSCTVQSEQSKSRGSQWSRDEDEVKPLIGVNFMNNPLNSAKLFSPFLLFQMKFNCGNSFTKSFA